MATVTERLQRAVEREAPSWGVRPVPPDHRRFSGVDLAVLWGDLSLGLLVLLTGALLVPALGFARTVLAIAVGTLLGCIPLALVGLAAAREGVPGMVLFRPLLGTRGSYIPSVLNIVQLVGWTGFEFWAMSLVANEMSTRLFGFSSFGVWLGIVAVVCTAFALGGPVLVVRRWLERFGAWVLGAVAAWLTVRLLTQVDLSAIWRSEGAGGFPGSFWLAVDLVIVMPVSWLPLVGDYNRFAKREKPSAIGTYVGYAVGNAWFYVVGALLVLAGGLSAATPGSLGLAIAGLAGGWVVLLALLVGETDQAFADIYSAAVSAQNVAPRLSQRGTIVTVAAAGTALAAWLGERAASAARYESFLFLLGSVFVPLFAVFVADYFVVNRRSSSQRRAAYEGGTDRLRGVRGTAAAAWLTGFLIYQWSVPTGPAGWQRAVATLFDGWLHLPFPLAGSAAGASIPSFVVAFVLYVALGAMRRSGTRPARGRATV